MTGRATRITNRDRDLLAHLVVARYLTQGQIERLMPFGRPGAASKTTFARRARLLRQAGVLGLQHYVNRRALRETAYHATLEGHGIGVTELQGAAPWPKAPLSPELLAHTIALNELYVGLVAASGPFTFSRMPFTWVATPAALLMTTLSAEGAHPEHRRLVPDAILETTRGAERLRVFIEYETGNHPTTRSDPAHTGSILSKVRRYASYFRRDVEAL